MAKSEGMVDKIKRKAKAAGAYVNDNLNPLTSKKTKAAAKSYMSKAKTGTVAGKATNVNTRMERLSRGSSRKGK